MDFSFVAGISLLAETLVSIKRIQNFMQYEETDVVDKSAEYINYEGSNQSTVKEDDKILEEEDAEKQPLVSNGHATLSEAGIIINKVKAKWDPSATEYTLDDVNLRVQPGTLVAIIGPVGAGKSR